MNRISLSAIALLFVMLMTAPAAAAHRLVVQGNGKLAIVDKEGKIEWEMSWRHSRRACS